MSHTSMILSALMTMTLVVLFAPNIFAMNRGRILRNIALWLAVFLGLALIYQNFGPGSEHPLFSTPDALQDMKQEDAKDKDGDEDGNPDLPASNSQAEPVEDGEQGFTPPKE